MEGAIAVASADFEDGLEVVFDNEVAQELADFGGDVPKLVAGGFEFLEEVSDCIIHRLLFCGKLLPLRRIGHCSPWSRSLWRR